jgi:hypothetical protein
MSTRICAFAGIALVGITAWIWFASTDSSEEMTQLALRQFHNDDAVSAELHQGSIAQNWRFFVWPALIISIGVLMFWDDVERWWRDEKENV